MKRFISLLIAAALGSMITLAVFEWRNDTTQGVKIEYQTTPVSAARLTASGEPLDFTVVAEKTTKAVVHIRSTIRSTQSPSNPDAFDFFFGPQRRGPAQGTGSGVIINSEGYIVTNNHVVADADIVEVTLHDNRTLKAEIIGTDLDTDLAVIRIKEKNLPYLSFVDSDQTKVGEWVLAVGNPYNLNSTVTAGIISAKARNIGIINSNNNPTGNISGNTGIESFIQTDAAVNPGNSGGALVNILGGLVGINTAIASDNGAFVGYSFAIPSNIVAKITEDLITYGKVQRGWLGVQVTSLNSEVVKREALEVNEGAFISDFGANSSAKEAGVQKGDVVVKLDNTNIKSSSELIEYIGRKRPGDKVDVIVNRKGKEIKIPVVLKNADGNTGTIRPVDKTGVESLGLEVQDISESDLRALEIKGGVRVSNLQNGKVKRYTEMRNDFIITHIDNKPIKSVKEFNDIMNKKSAGDLIIFSGIYEDYPGELSYALRM
ncbi:MAG: Do family serine endopeptidase [Flammeovirgaceae bacterium]|nr:Do family serine endopeptidase [Flammeovirgaceae bacterium]